MTSREQSRYLQFLGVSVINSIKSIYSDHQHQTNCQQIFSAEVSTKYH